MTFSHRPPDQAQGSPDNDRRAAARYVPLPSPRQFVGLRLAPGIRYTLPETALESLVSVKDRDLLLTFPQGGKLQLHDLITIEAMARSPIFQLGDRDILGSMLAVTALAHGDGASLGTLLRLSSELLTISGNTFGAALQALMRNGRQPKACFTQRQAALPIASSLPPAD